MSNLRSVDLSMIRENTVALRDVNRQSEEYLGLVESIKQKGFISTISVRPKTDEDGVDYYELVDGLHRFNAAKDAGLSEINVNIIDLDDSEVLEAQVMANIHKVETKPVQYSQQLKRILTMNPLMTESELAGRLGKSSGWISQRLGLNAIEDDNIKSLIDEGKICLSNAYALAKLPQEEHSNFVDRAMTEPPDQFVPAIHKRAKEIKEARRKGQEADSVEWSPTQHLQKIGAFKDELETNAVGNHLIAKTDATTPIEAWNLAIQWSLHVDPESTEVQRQQHEKRMAEREEAKKRKAAERAKAKQDKADAAAQEAADAQAALA